MKRSEVNEILLESNQFIRSFGYHLPSFAYWSVDQMIERVATDSQEIYNSRMGWDITDYGQGNFKDLGLFLFTTRNGMQSNVKRGMGMLYAEKIMISRESQISPMHHHNYKTEDIINRGGATLVLELWSSTAYGEIDSQAAVHVLVDGRRISLEAGAYLALKPGESVTLEPHHWHSFWGEGGDVLIGEVSNVNDDLADNIFRDPIGRFSQIEEDQDPVHLLVSDYDTWLSPAQSGQSK
jgi:D-lyxose ketol-isomerase